MPEILTESFCERCGTRYTFESAAPKRRPLSGVRTLSKGLRNFVLSDDSSLSEAMADARSDDERQLSAGQLDAFHKTFNFCMTCRQYTCSNCWNESDGRCLTCAPHLSHEILPAPFPDLDPATGLALAGANGHSANGHELDEDWPDIDLSAERYGRVLGADAAQAFAGTQGDQEPAGTEPTANDGDRVGAEVLAIPAEPADAELDPDVAAAVAAAAAHPADTSLVADAEPAAAEGEQVAAEAEALVAQAALLAAAAEPVEAQSLEPDAERDASPSPADTRVMDEPPVDLLAERGYAPVPTVTPRSAAGRTPSPTDGSEATVDARAAAAAAQTAALLAKFRPGQSLDEALAAYEEELARARGEGVEPTPASEATVAPTPTPEQPDLIAPIVPVAAASDVEPEPEADDHAARRIAAGLVAAELATPDVPDRPDVHDRVVREVHERPAAQDLDAAERLAREPIPSPQPAAEQTPAAEPVAADESGRAPEPRRDVIEQPVWPSTAPGIGTAPTAPPEPAAPSQPAAPAQPVTPAPAQPWALTPPGESVEPEWPATPQWPSGQGYPTPSSARAQRSPDVPMLAGRPLVPDRSIEALWAASSHEVMARPAASGAAVQPCVNCGLSLSTTARFCRRCGTPQG